MACMYDRADNLIARVIEKLQAAENADKYLDGLVHLGEAQEAMIWLKGEAFRSPLDKRYRKKIEKLTKRLNAVSKQF